MPIKGKQKFSVNLPLLQDNENRRLWDPSLQYNHSLGWEAGVPSSKKIVKDTMRVPQYSIVMCFDARGCVVPCYGTYKGCLYEGMNEVGEWDGHHIRKDRS
eukprot:12015097-Ditylum_brightwellii.AAC.1